MPCCGRNNCNCVVQSGDGATVTGSGTADDPYVVSATGSEECNCDVTGGTGATVTGDGSPGNPFVVNAGCNCLVTAGPGATVSGNGSPGTPYVVSAPPTCNCLVTAGDGTTVTGDGSPGNPYVINAPDSGGACNCVVEAGCGVTVTGIGSIADPFTVAADVAAWPFPCDIATQGDDVYCDPANGQLKIRPSQRVITDQVNAGPLVTMTGAEWCATQPTNNTQFNLPAPHRNVASAVFTNPSSCCPMLLEVTAQGRVRIDRDQTVNGESGIGFDMLVNGAMFGRIQYQNTGLSAGATVWQDGEHQPLPPIVIPPGGNVQVGWQLFQTGLVGCPVTHVRYNSPTMQLVGYTLDC